MEQRILNLFLNEESLKFSEIVKKLNTRSNKINYHLKSLVKKGVLEKEDSNYKLSEAAEYLIPYLSEKKSPLPVLLIYIGEKTKVFLHRRKKRPYKDLLSLPGGRMVLGESIDEGVKRIMKEKYSLDAELKQVHSVSLEHIKKGNKIVHSFLLIFVSANSDNAKLTSLKGNKAEITPSDYFLIKNNLGKKLDINTINSLI